MTQEKKQFSHLFVLLVLFFTTLPLFVSVQDVLTRLLAVTNLSMFVQSSIIPFEIRVLLFLFHLIGIPATGNIRGIVMPASAHGHFSAQILWSCIGWQSLFLFIITLLTGLSGRYSLGSKLQVIGIGLLGTFWVNIFRIMMVYLLGFYFGELPAMIFHNVLGTLLIICWLFWYWWFAYSSVLEEHRARTK